MVSGTDRGGDGAPPRKGTRQQIAFYGSTPAYRGVLDLHGWGGLQEELNALSKQGKWVEMGELIDDEILHTFAVVGEPEEIGPELLKRYGDCIDRISFYAPYKSDPERWAAVGRPCRRAEIDEPSPALRRGAEPDVAEVGVSRVGHLHLVLAAYAVVLGPAPGDDRPRGRVDHRFDSGSRLPFHSSSRVTPRRGPFS